MVRKLCLLVSGFVFGLSFAQASASTFQGNPTHPAALLALFVGGVGMMLSGTVGR